MISRPIRVDRAINFSTDKIGPRFSVFQCPRAREGPVMSASVRKPSRSHIDREFWLGDEETRRKREKDTMRGMRLAVGERDEERKQTREAQEERRTKEKEHPEKKGKREKERQRDK